MNNEPIEIEPEIAAVVRENARALGLSVNEYLSLLLPTETEMALSGEPQVDSFETDILSFGTGSKRGGSYVGSYDRADIYFDHD